MTYSIRDFGARQSDLLQTKAIQAAIDACFTSGGGEVIVPAGIYRTGGLRLRSGVTLHLMSGAILEGSTDPEDYCTFLDDAVEPLTPYDNPSGKRSSDPLSRWNNALIRAIEAHDIAIIGEPYSYIDGCNCFDPEGEEKYRGPHGINLQMCRNITLRGYTIRNTGNWAHQIVKSRNVRIENVTALAGHDGIDLMLCEHMQVSGCRIESGDDAIAGFGSRDVRICDCLLNSSCSSVRFGGTDVVFERCRAEADPPYAFRGSIPVPERSLGRMPAANATRRNPMVYRYYCDLRYGPLPYKPGNITFRDCDFDGVWSLFFMTYGQHIWCNGHPLTSIRFENCRASRLREPIYIWGDPDEPIDFTLDGMTMAADPAFPQSLLIEANHFKSITVRSCRFEGFTAPHILAHSDAPVIIDASGDIAVRREAAAEQKQGN